MTASGPRALSCERASDEITIEATPDGRLRYFNAERGIEHSYRHPYILELEITRRCNLRCVHCYAQASDRPFADELSFAEIEAVLDDARSIDIGELALTGGEVMLHPRLLDIIDAAVAREFAVRFVTNGTLLDDALLEQLCRRPIKLITISLDGVSAEAHQRIRGSGSHAATTAAIDKLSEAGFEVSVISAFSRLNIDEFDALLAFCSERGINWQVQMTSAKGRCPEEITLSPEQYYELGEKVAAAIASDPPMHIIPMDDLATYSHFAPLDLLSGTWKQACPGGVLNIFVRANGDVTPCSALAFDECVVGSLRRERLSTICREERCREALAWLRPETLTGICAKCGFRSECRGGCPEILLSMCRERTENEYCYHRVEQQRVIREVFGDDR